MAAVSDKDQSDSPPDKSRRAFMFFVPLGAIGGMFVAFSTAAFRFLRPVVSARGQQWIDVAVVGEINGSKPIARKVVVEQIAGWGKSFAPHSVYILPAKNNQVLSAVCPHEGCEVSWQAEENVFACPCHDSNFAADGARLYGPARRGLDILPSRVEEGKLQVQFLDFESNTTARTPRI
jgi:Rieske Fe-S protein